MASRTADSTDLIACSLGSISPYSDSFLANSVYTFCVSCCCHMIKLLLTDCLVNAQRYLNLSFLHGPQPRSEYFSPLTAQSVLAQFVTQIFVTSLTRNKALKGSLLVNIENEKNRTFKFSNFAKV